MALSNSFSFSVTAYQIICAAMLMIGALGEGEIPTAQEYTDCLLWLNMLAKEWMAKQDFAPGLQMWQRARGDLFLSQSKGQYLLGPASNADNWAGGVATSLTANYQQAQLLATAATGATTLSVGSAATALMTVGDYVVITLDGGDIYTANIGSINNGAGTFTFSGSSAMPSQASANQYVWNYTIRGQRPIAIETGVLRYITDNDFPLNVMTLQDYEALPTKVMPTYLSDPTAYYYESQFGSQLNTPQINGPGMLYLDVGGASDVTKHLHMVYLRPIMDLVNPGDNPEFPQQWYGSLVCGVARRICPMFDAEWTPEMAMNYQESTGIARQADAEVTSMYFEPDRDVP